MALQKKVIAAVILGAMALTVILAVAIGMPSRTGARNYAGKGSVGVVYIEGVIGSGRSGGIFGGVAGSEEVASTIREAARKPEIKAVVIRLNSPGGTPAASQEIAAEVDRLKESGKKVVVSMGDSAASGAYWIACRADQIVANPGTLTGSIGVIMQTKHYEDLYEKIGVTPETFKSGQFKDMGSADRPVTPEERVLFQAMIDDLYDQFISVVASGRGKEIAEIRHLADGRVFTGRQAKELGLVDRLGDFHDAVLLAGELAGIQGEPSVTEIGRRNIWRDMIPGTKGLVWTPAGLLLPLWGGSDLPLQVR